MKLSEPDNFLSWLAVNRFPIGFDKIRIANVINDALDDEDDRLTMKYITNLTEIIQYMKAKYITGVNIINTTLGPIRKLNTDEECIKAN